MMILSKQEAFLKAGSQWHAMVERVGQAAKEWQSRDPDSSKTVVCLMDSKRASRDMV